MQSHGNQFGASIVRIIAILFVWNLCAFSVSDPKLFPSTLYVVLESLPSIAHLQGKPSGFLDAGFVILFHSLITSLRLVVGVTIGVFSGIIFGLGAYFIPAARPVNNLIIAAIKSTPLFALIPLFLFWFGGSGVGVYLYIAFCVAVVISTSTSASIQNVSPLFVQQAQILGASRSQIFATVYLNAIGPELLGSLRNVIGLSWAFSLGAEYLAASSGLGYLVYQSYLYADMGKLVLLACLYGSLGLLSTYMTEPVFRFLGRWQNN